MHSPFCGAKPFQHSCCSVLGAKEWNWIPCKCSSKTDRCISMTSCRDIGREVNFVCSHLGTRRLWVLQALHWRDEESALVVKQLTMQFGWSGSTSVLYSGGCLFGTWLGHQLSWWDIWKTSSVTAGKFRNSTSKYEFRLSLRYEINIISIFLDI